MHFVDMLLAPKLLTVTFAVGYLISLTVETQSVKN